MRSNLLIILIAALSVISACSANTPVMAVEATPTTLPVITPTNTTIPVLPTFAPPPTSVSPTLAPAERSGFPFAALLNDALPREGLVLARHYYADPDESQQGDEVCYDIGIYQNETYIAISCQPGFTYPAPTGPLDDTQKKYFRRWLATFQTYEEPSIHGLFLFNGNGQTPIDSSTKISMQAMVSKIDWDAHQYASGGGYPMVVFHTRSLLMAQLNMWLDNSNILKFESVTFPDSCLNAPKPNEVCEPVATQGFRIYLVARGLLYEFHTDVFGYDIRPFGEPQPAPTPAPVG